MASKFVIKECSGRFKWNLFDGQGLRIATSSAEFSTEKICRIDIAVVKRSITKFTKAEVEKA